MFEKEWSLRTNYPAHNLEVNVLGITAALQLLCSRKLLVFYFEKKKKRYEKTTGEGLKKKKNSKELNNVLSYYFNTGEWMQEDLKETRGS